LPPTEEVAGKEEADVKIEALDASKSDHSEGKRGDAMHLRELFSKRDSPLVDHSQGEDNPAFQGDEGGPKYGAVEVFPTQVRT